MPHNPTSSGPPLHTPTTCWCCGRHATGIGMDGFGRDGRGDPRWLCDLCVPLMHQIRAARTFDTYEENAVTATILGVGDLVAEWGSDLAEWEEAQVRQFVTEIILGFGDAIREQVRSTEVPF